MPLWRAVDAHPHGLSDTDERNRVRFVSPSFQPAEAGTSPTGGADTKSFGRADGLPPDSTVSHLSSITPRSPKLNRSTVTPRMSTETLVHVLGHPA